MENFRFFQNKNCEFFPCHDCDPDKFNCMYCHCPLYALGKDCDGDYIFLENGTKSCEKCSIPHTENGYEHILKHINKVIEKAKN